MLSEYRAACVLNVAAGILDYEQWQLLCPSTIIAAAEFPKHVMAPVTKNSPATGHTSLSINIVTSVELSLFHVMRHDHSLSIKNN